MDYQSRYIPWSESIKHIREHTGRLFRPGGPDLHQILLITVSRYSQQEFFFSDHKASGR